MKELTKKHTLLDLLGRTVDQIQIRARMTEAEDKRKGVTNG